MINSVVDMLFSEVQEVRFSSTKDKEEQEVADISRNHLFRYTKKKKKEKWKIDISKY